MVVVSAKKNSQDSAFHHSRFEQSPKKQNKSFFSRAYSCISQKSIQVKDSVATVVKKTCNLVNNFGKINTAATVAYTTAVAASPFSGGLSLLAIPTTGICATAANYCAGHLKSAAVHAAITAVSLPIIATLVPFAGVSVKRDQEDQKAAFSDPNDFQFTSPFEGLSTAAKFGNLKKFEPLLKIRQIITKQELENFNFLLFQAAENGHLDVVKYIIENFDIDLSSQDSYGNTALMLATQHGKLDVVKHLVTHPKIDLSAKKQAILAINYWDDSNYPILEFLIQEPGVYLSLHQSERNELLKELLLDRKFETVLALASQAGLVLAEDLSFQDKNGHTILMEAIKSSRLDIVQFLVKFPGTDLSLQDEGGRTPLLLSMDVFTSSNEIRMYLATHTKADLSDRDNNGRSLLQAATCETPYLPLIETLLKLPQSKNQFYTLHGYSPLICIKSKSLSYTPIQALGWQRVEKITRQRPNLFSPIERKYEKWFRGWKEISHILEIGGDVSISDQDQFSLEGSLDRFYYAGRLADSLHEFSKQSIGMLSLQKQETVQKVEEALEKYSNHRWYTPGQIFNRWKAGKLVILPAGYYWHQTLSAGHATGILIYKNWLITSDLSGDSRAQGAYQVFRLEKDKLTSDFIGTILRTEDEKSDEDYYDLIEKIKGELARPKGDLEKQLEKMIQPLQKMGNCAWAHLEASLQAGLVITALDYIPSPYTKEQVQSIINQQHLLYRELEEFHQKRRTKEHHKMLTRLQPDPSWKIASKAVAQIKEIWKRYGLPRIPVAVID